MCRVARIVVPGFPHHITQRGNRGAVVFEEDADREAYLRLLGKYSARHGLALWAYCLMSNHVHLVAVPAREDSLALALRDTHTVYAMRFNTRTRLNGHVWQGRFYSCPMDEAHLWAAVRYVERNPVRARLVERAETYAWSSAAAHCRLRHDALLDPAFPTPGVVEDWPAWLSNEEDAEASSRIRAHTRTGRPCGRMTFLEQLEAQLQRVLRPKQRGRRPKQRQEAASLGGSE